MNGFSGELDTLDVKDKFVVVMSDDLNERMLRAINETVKNNGALGVIGMSLDDRVDSIDVKDQVLVIMSDSVTEASTKIIKKEATDRGALGVLFIGREDRIDNLSIASLEQILANAKLKQSVVDAAVKGNSDG